MAIQMSNREKYFVGFAASAVIVFIVFQFVISPFIANREKKRRQVDIKAEELTRMRDLKTEYEALIKKNKSADKAGSAKDRGFTLFSYLEKLAGTTSVKENISYMKPSTTVQKDTRLKLSLVEMKLQAVSTKKLMQFLYEVETSSNAIFIRGISITKTGKEKKLLNAVIQLETVKQES